MSHPVEGPTQSGEDCHDEEAPLVKHANEAGPGHHGGGKARVGQPARSRVRLFAVLYFLLLAPVLWSLFDELLNPPSTAPAIIAMEPSTKGLFYWMLVNLALYGLLRVACSSLGWKQHSKHPSQHKEDLLRMARLSTSIGIIGRVANRVATANGLAFLVMVVYFTWFFTIVFEVSKTLNITLTPDCLYNPFTVSVTTMTTLVVAGVVGLHCLFASRDKDLTDFLGFISLGLLYHFLLIIGPGKAHVHVHHWYWAWAITHMCVFDSKTSEIAQAMFCGAYIHGVALFGVEKIFYERAGEEAAEVYS